MIRVKILILLHFIILPYLAEAQNSDSKVTVLVNELSHELALKISGTQYAISFTNKEEVDQAINQRDYGDLFGKLQEYLVGDLKLKGYAFTESQRQELTSKSEFSICDFCTVALDPGTFHRTLGALGVYKKANLQFRFCDGSQYKVMLSDISVDGYSYHPNRFAAAFDRIRRPKMYYIPQNRLSINKLPILATREMLDSLIVKREGVYVGEYQSLGFEKNSLRYSFAIVQIEGKWYGLYTGGGNKNDWSVGEIKVELTATKSDKIFLCNWYNSSKQKVENTSIVFDDENSFTVKNDAFTDKFVRLK